MSGAGLARTVEIAEHLELFRAVLDRVGVKATLEPRVPIVVYVFRDAQSFSRFRPRSGVEGFMLPREHRNYLVLHAGEEADARGTALHEYVHFILRNGEAVQYPAWYDEGLAEFLSTITIEDGNVVIGRVPLSRAMWLRYGSPLSQRRLMTADGIYRWSDRALARFYAQAWATVHFFHTADRVGFPARYSQMVRYIALLNRGLSADDACIEAFGTDFEGLEAEFMRYVGAKEVPYLGLPVSELEIHAGHDATPLPHHEKELRIGELALALGPPWHDDAVDWLRRATRSDPEDARAQATLGRALGRSDPDAADAAFERARSIDDADAEIHRLRGDDLLERASRAQGDAAVELVSRARRAFARSIELDPEQVAAYAGLGRTHLAAPGLGDPADGLAALETARERLPADRGILLTLAQLEASQGRTARARALLTQLPAPSHGDPVGDGEGAIEATRRAVGLPEDAPLATRHLVSRLRIETPLPGARIRGLAGWVEVAGRGGLWESTLHDVVIVIDESTSTLGPTGADLDGDGVVGAERGQGRRPEHFSSDPDDAIISAEIEAAKALIRQLDPETTRVAVSAFAADSRIVTPLGTPASALDALALHLIRVDPSGTSLAAALTGALSEFEASREVGVRRQRTILLLSDGQPTVPSESIAKRDALELADELGRIGVPVQAFALGETALEDPDFYRSLAERSGGHFVPVENPADVPGELASVRFTGLLDVAMRSDPADEPGRAVRVFPDGSFDGYVPLVEGENLITIEAAIEGGRTLSATRTVHFERPAAPSADDERESDALRLELEARAIDLELLREIRRRRSGASRRLEMEVDEHERELPE